MQTLSKFFKDLWKRKVVQFGAIYIGASWLVLQGSSLAIAETPLTKIEVVLLFRTGLRLS